MIKVGQNWGPLDRQASAAAKRRKQTRSVKFLALLILAGLAMLICSGMVS